MDAAKCPTCGKAQEGLPEIVMDNAGDVWFLKSNGKYSMNYGGGAHGNTPYAEMLSMYSPLTVLVKEVRGPEVIIDGVGDEWHRNPAQNNYEWMRLGRTRPLLARDVQEIRDRYGICDSASGALRD